MSPIRAADPSAQFPTTGPAVFFLLATSWFAVKGMGVATVESRTLYGYHSLMMLATSWMYLYTNGGLLAEHAGLHPSASMPGMNMAAPDEPTSGEVPAWAGSVNWLGIIVFTSGAVFWARRSACCRSLGNLAQLAIAAGTAIMFVSMVFRI